MQIKDTIRQRSAVDVDPPISDTAQYMRNDMTRHGYRHLLAISEFLNVQIHLSN